MDYQRDSAHHHLKFLLPNFYITIATNIAPIASDIASIATIDMLLLLSIATHSEFTVTDLPVLVSVHRPDHVVNFTKRYLVMMMKMTMMIMKMMINIIQMMMMKNLPGQIGHNKLELLCWDAACLCNEYILT